MSESYAALLKRKAERFESQSCGIEPGYVSDVLFPFQKAIVEWACRKGRAAIFAGCGLGKTFMQLEWARLVQEQAPGVILIVAPLAVSLQTVQEGIKIGVPVQVCKTSRDMGSGINITNYERLDRFDDARIDIVVLDESSILKSLTGKTRQKIEQMFSDTPYRLCCTATPSPNDHMELLNHAQFLGVEEVKISLSTFFVHDSGNTAVYRIKKHAISAFWQWVSTWAVAMEHPSDLGYDDDGFVLPPLEIVEHVLPVDSEIGQGDMLFRIPDLSATSIHREKRLTAEARARKTADLVEGSEKPVCVWCDTNYEADILKKYIPDAVEVRGSDKPEKKEQVAIAFANGEVPILISKASIFGFGMNFQICNSVIFAGISYSYESYYQAIRRFWRFGQGRPVTAHIVIGETEKNIMQTIRRKEKQFMEMRSAMESEILEFCEIKGGRKTKAPQNGNHETDTGTHHTIIKGDCVTETKRIKSDSVGFQIFSPPFSNLFVYSDALEDMGNVKDDSEFFDSFAYLAPELYRTLVPGRLCAVHCSQIPIFKGQDGYLGIKDFRGDIIRAMQHAGFIYHSEVCIWKDPVVEMTRTKAIGLLHKQIKKDSSVCRQGLPDYLCVFRKWPESGETCGDDPVSRPGGFGRYVGEEAPRTDTTGNYSIEVWQRYASPVWFDIKQGRVLNYRMARDEKDEKHICPLQLDVIERAIHLWTNEGDTVFSPFAGIGSEGFCAVKMGRKFVGVELKEQYWKHAVMNVLAAYGEKETLF